MAFVDLVVEEQVQVLDLSLCLNAQKELFIHGESKEHSLKTGLVHNFTLTSGSQPFREIYFLCLWGRRGEGSHAIPRIASLREEEGVVFNDATEDSLHLLESAIEILQ